MSVSPSLVRTHRMIGAAAVLHAAIIGGIILDRTIHGRFPSIPLWIALVTSWLVWPIALVVHRGRSLRRVLIPLLVSTPFLCLIWRDYVFAPPLAFGLPIGLTLYPPDLYHYFVAHRAGHAEAEQDLRAGVLAIEGHGYPMPPKYAQILRDRYGVQVRWVAGDTDITAKVLGHAAGYNELSAAEIKRRFGDGVIEEAADESLKRWHEKSSK